MIHIRFLWSVYISNPWPSNIVPNYFNVSLMINSPLSITVYLIWWSVIFLLYTAICFQSCLITSPNFIFPALVFFLILYQNTDNLKNNLAMIRLIYMNTSCLILFYITLTLMEVILVQGSNVCKLLAQILWW